MVKEATISEHTPLITNLFTCTGVYKLKWASQAISLQNTSSKITLRIYRENHRFYIAFIPLFNSTAKIIDFKRLRSEHRLHPPAARWKTCKSFRKTWRSPRFSRPCCLHFFCPGGKSGFAPPRSPGPHGKPWAHRQARVLNNLRSQWGPGAGRGAATTLGASVEEADTCNFFYIKTNLKNYQ